MESAQIANPVSLPENTQVVRYEERRQPSDNRRAHFHPNWKRSFYLLVFFTVVVFAGVCWGMFGGQDNSPAVRKAVLNNDKASAIEFIILEDKRNSTFLFCVVISVMAVVFAWACMCHLNNQEFRNDAIDDVAELKDVIKDIHLKQSTDENEKLAHDKDAIETEKEKIQAESAELKKKMAQLKQEVLEKEYKLKDKKEATTAAAQARESMMRAADEARQRNQAAAAREREIRQQLEEARGRASTLEEQKKNCVVQ